MDDSKKSGFDAAARAELRAMIKFLSQLHTDLTGKAPTPEELIETLRERGQNAQADEFEHIVARVRAGRRDP
jgi:hypothetical protein